MPARPLSGLVLLAALTLSLAPAVVVEAAVGSSLIVFHQEGDLIISDTVIRGEVVYIVEGNASLIMFDHVDIRGNVTVVTVNANISRVILSNVKGGGVELINVTAPRITVVNSTLGFLYVYTASSGEVFATFNGSRIGEVRLYSSPPVLVEGLASNVARLYSDSNITLKGVNVGLLEVFSGGVTLISYSSLETLVAGSASTPVGGVVVEASKVGVQGSINESGRPGLVSVFASGSVDVKGSRLYLGRLHVMSEGLTLRDSWLYVETLLVHAPRVVFEDSRVSIAAGRGSLGGESGLVLEVSNSTLNLQEPWVVYVSQGVHEARVYGSTLICPRGCITLVLMDANITVNLTSSIFQGDPALVAVAYPPNRGRAVIVAGDCYFQSPLGPTVVVGGNVVRRGGSTIAVSGSAVGSVSVYSWRATASGPLLSPGAEAVDVEVYPSTLVEYARALQAPGRLAVIAYSPTPTLSWRVESVGYTVVAALAPTGWGIVEGGNGSYTVRLPRPSHYIVAFLEPAERVESTPTPTATAATPAPTTESTQAGRESLRLQLVAAATLLAGLIAGYATVRRGRS